MIELGSKARADAQLKESATHVVLAKYGYDMAFGGSWPGAMLPRITVLWSTLL